MWNWSLHYRGCSLSFLISYLLETRMVGPSGTAEHTAKNTTYSDLACEIIKTEITNMYPTL